MESVHFVVFSFSLLNLLIFFSLSLYNRFYKSQLLVGVVFWTSKFVSLLHLLKSLSESINLQWAWWLGPSFVSLTHTQTHTSENKIVIKILIRSFYEDPSLKLDPSLKVQRHTLIHTPMYMYILFVVTFTRMPECMG